MVGGECSLEKVDEDENLGGDRTQRALWRVLREQISFHSVQKKIQEKLPKLLLLQILLLLHGLHAGKYRKSVSS